MNKSRLAFIGILAVFAGCGGGSQLSTGPDLFTYVGSAQVTSNSPMRFTATMTVFNSTTQSVTFTTGCPIQRLLVYNNATFSGSPIYDSNTRANLPACSQTQVTLAPNRSVAYNLNLNGADVLGAAGNPGTYYLATEVTLDGVPYAVSAGSLALAR